MKFLKILGGIVLVLALIFVIGSFFLPTTYSVSRSTVINAPDSIIYENIANYNEFYKWNAWSKMDQQAKVTISNRVAQPGHLYQWNGKESGEGQMKIIAVERNKMVDMELKFIKPMESTADTRFDIAQEATGHKVIWTMSGKCEGMFSKWLSLMMDKMIGKDFEEGLKSLKEKSEARK